MAGVAAVGVWSRSAGGVSVEDPMTIVPVGRPRASARRLWLAGCLVLITSASVPDVASSSASGEVVPEEPWSASQYDGQVWTTDAPDLAPSARLPTVHAVYLYPSDGPNRFAQFAAMFQRDARRASSVLNTLYGRGI